MADKEHFILSKEAEEDFNSLGAYLQNVDLSNTEEIEYTRVGDVSRITLKQNLETRFSASLNLPTEEEFEEMLKNAVPVTDPTTTEGN